MGGEGKGGPRSPAALGKRARIKGGKLADADGPFIETGEAIDGFAIFELPGVEAAVESARSSLHLEHVPGWEGTCEIRQIAGSQAETIRGSGPGPCVAAN